MVNNKALVAMLIVVVIAYLVINPNINLQSTAELEPTRGKAVFDSFDAGLTCPIEYLEFDGIYGFQPKFNDDTVEAYFKDKFGQSVPCGILVRRLNNNYMPTVSNSELKLTVFTADVGSTKIISDSTLYIFNDFFKYDSDIYYKLSGSPINSIQGTPDRAGTGTLTTSTGAIDEMTSSRFSSAEKEAVMRISRGFLDPNIVTINIAGRETQSDVSNLNVFFLKLTGQGTVKIDEIRYSIPYVGDCGVSVGDVVVFDDFAKGSKISWADPRTFTYEPKRFCFEHPAWAYSSEQQGIRVDKNADLIQKLADGGSHIVSEGDFIRVTYVTNFVEGMEPSCPVGSAINTNTGKCQQIVEEAPVILQCNAKSDCLVPDSCDSSQVSCVNGLCSYEGVQCKNEVLVKQEIILQKENKVVPLDVGAQTILIKNNVSKTQFSIGSLSGTISVVSNNDVQITIDGTSKIGNYKYNDYLTLESEVFGVKGFDGAFTDSHYIITKAIISPFIDEKSVEHHANYDIDQEVSVKSKTENLAGISFSDANEIYTCYKKAGLQDSVPQVISPTNIPLGINEQTSLLENKGKGVYSCVKKTTVTLADYNQVTKTIQASKNQIFFTYSVSEDSEDFENQVVISGSEEQPTPEKSNNNVQLIIIGVVALGIIIYAVKLSGGGR
ncbi:MAG: hypothetical protein U9O94_08470 [Nanoarchaeota archaeon]|nr:hypothetical protein [Nanoarchaeota archaeon]